MCYMVTGKVGGFWVKFGCGDLVVIFTYFSSIEPGFKTFKNPLNSLILNS